MQQVPPLCTQAVDLHLAVVPLISYHIVEWHQPDRCLRQFGLDQPIPQEPGHTDHHLKMAGRVHEDWSTYHRDFIAYWHVRRDRVVTGVPLLDTPLPYRSQYMEWYRRVTRRWLSPNGAVKGAIVS